MARNWRRRISLGRADSFCSRSSLPKAAVPESRNCIRLGSQDAPSSIAPHFRFGKRSKTPSITRAESVCQMESGIAMKVREVKFSSPPWKSFTKGRPFSM